MYHIGTTSHNTHIVELTHEEWMAFKDLDTMMIQTLRKTWDAQVYIRKLYDEYGLSARTFHALHWGIRSRDKNTLTTEQFLAKLRNGKVKEYRQIGPAAISDLQKAVMRAAEAGVP